MVTLKSEDVSIALPSLCSIPFDVLLVIVQSLDLQDSISLSTVCRHLRYLSDHRSYWLLVLKTAQESTFLACPISGALIEKTTEDLRAIAFRTHRRNRNLSSSEPRIMAPVTVLDCWVPQGFLIEVPGTPLIVTHSSKDGFATCWNVQRKENLRSIYIGQRTFKMTRLLEGPGKLLIIISTSSLKIDKHPTSFLFLRVNFDASPLAKKEPFQLLREHILPRNFEVKSTCSTTQWTVMLNSAGPFLRLFVFSNHNGKTSVIETDLESDGGSERIDLSFGGKDLYMIIHYLDDRKYTELTEVYRCPSDIFSQATGGPASSVVKWNCNGVAEEYEYPSHVGAVRYRIVDTSRSDPDRRLFMTVYQSTVRSLKIRAVGLKFWSLSDLFGVPSAAPVHSCIIPGSLRTSYGKQHLFAGSYSGRYYVVLGECGRACREWSLRLLYYDEDRRQSSVRKLPVPSTIPLASVQSLSFDEYLGVVYMLLMDGTVYSIPYA